MTSRVRVVWDHQVAIDAANASTKDGIEKAAEIILALADAHVPWGEGDPYDTHPGLLMSSGKTSYDAVQDAGTVYYDTPYAKKLHEDRRLHLLNGRSNRWLYTACMKGRPDVAVAFADAAKMHFHKVTPFHPSVAGVNV